MLPASHEIAFRVRYQETDGQGRVHHANYFSWFETGRVELLRAGGLSYKSLEEQGIMLVVADIQCRYFLPAEFDDLLKLVTTTVRARGARIDQEYRVLRGEQLLAEAKSTVACIDKSGKLQRLPDWLIGEAG